SGQHHCYQSHTSLELIQDYHRIYLALFEVFKLQRKKKKKEEIYITDLRQQHIAVSNTISILIDQRQVPDIPDHITSTTTVSAAAAVAAETTTTVSASASPLVSRPTSKSWHPR
ncbi:hypothetical protein EGW08_018970, partial [Elysia chlorotica]